MIRCIKLKTLMGNNFNRNYLPSFILLHYFLFPFSSFSQISTASSGSFWAKEYSKEIALYKAKTFVLNDVLGISKDIVQFYIDPLAAASSGELTTLVYRCEAKNKEGLILGFYGNRWN